MLKFPINIFWKVNFTHNESSSYILWCSRSWLESHYWRLRRQLILGRAFCVANDKRSLFVVFFLFVCMQSLLLLLLLILTLSDGASGNARITSASSLSMLEEKKVRVPERNIRKPSNCPSPRMEESLQHLSPWLCKPCSRLSVLRRAASWRRLFFSFSSHIF